MSKNTFSKKSVMQMSILLVIVLGFLTILAGMFVDMNGTKGKKQPVATTQVTPTATAGTTSISLGIVKKIDQESNVITITDINMRQDCIFSFSGGTKVTSRYGKVLMVKELMLGEIVKAKVEPDTNRVTDIEITSEAWEYKDVTNWTMDKEKKAFQIGSKAFNYGTIFGVFNSQGEVDSNALSNKDKLIVKGINGQVYSVIVSKGHGTFQLANYTQFIDGNIEIGYDTMTKVEEDQIFTLTEGDYRVTIKKGKLEAVKYVHITAGQVTTLDLKEYKNQSAQQGKVRFNITPDGADLYINNVATEYSSEVTLEYGEYDVKISCAGYQTFSEKLTVGKSFETLYIDLVDSSKSKATATPAATDSAETAAPTTSVTVTPIPLTTAVPSASATATESPSATASPNATSAALKQDTDHTITINGPSGVQVYVNEEYKGTIPLTMTKVIGTDIKCTLKKAGQADKTYTLTVNDDKTNVSWQFSQWW